MKAESKEEHVETVLVFSSGLCQYGEETSSRSATKVAGHKIMVQQKSQNEQYWNQTNPASLRERVTPCLPRASSLSLQMATELSFELQLSQSRCTRMTVATGGSCLPVRITLCAPDAVTALYLQIVHAASRCPSLCFSTFVRLS
jgi:hypothetical protein